MEKDFMAAMLGDVEKIIEKAEVVPFWACDNCEAVIESVEAGANCQSCKTGRLFRGSTKKIAENLANRSKEAQEKKALQIELVSLGVPFTPRQGVKKLKELIEEANKPQIVIEEVNTEVVVEEDTTETETKEVEKVEEKEKGQGQGQVDYKAAREKATKAFIKDNKLSEHTPTPVGFATVQAHGFTVWQKQKPSFRLQQPFESGADFGQVYDKARAISPALSIDVVQCNDITNQALKACLYNGNILAGLNNGNGTITVRRNETVSIGALKTSKGHLRFIVLSVKAS